MKQFLLVSTPSTRASKAYKQLELPEGCEVISCESHGSSAWTTTARITATLADGTEKRYFLKVTHSLTLCVPDAGLTLTSVRH